MGVFIMNVKSLPHSNNFTGSVSGESSLSEDQSVTRNEISIPAYADTTKGKVLPFEVKMLPMKSEKVMVCKNDDCNYKDIKSRTFTKHLLSHIDDEDKLDYFHCAQSKCITGTRTTLGRLIDHVTTHVSNNTKFFRYSCDICTFRTTHLSYLISHEKTKAHLKLVSEHKSEQIGGTDQNALTKTTSNIQSYECQYCSFTTHNTSVLSKHQKKKHKLEKPKYICQMCGFTSNKKICFLQHQRTKKHLKNEVIEQQKLSDKIDQPQVAREHQTHGVEKGSPTKFNFHCKKCPYVTYCKGLVDQHMVVHLKDEESIKFKCELCSYTTIHKSNFHRHKKLCGPIDKNLQCDKCDYTTASKTCLQAHKKTHIPYHKRHLHKCSQDNCLFVSAYKSNVKRHIETHMAKNENTSSRKRKHSPERSVPTESVVFVKSEPGISSYFRRQASY